MSSIDLNVIYGREDSIFKKTARDALGFHFVYQQPITKTSIYSVFEAITNDDLEGITSKKCDSYLESPDHDDSGDSLESFNNYFDDSLDFEEPDLDFGFEDFEESEPDLGFEHDFKEPYFEATDFDHDLPAGEPLSSKFADINHISDLAALVYGNSTPTPTSTPTSTAGEVSWATKDVLKAAGLNDDMSPIAKDNEDEQSTLETLLDSDDTPPKDADISFKGDAYILAYRDRKSSEIVVITALESDKEGFELLLKELNDFLSRNCGYCDFQARWMNNSSYNSQYSNVRVITAFNTKLGQEEVLFVSKKMGISQIGEDTVGLTNIVDIGFAIDGLIVNGALDFQKEALEAKGETCDDVPVVVLAQLRNPYRSISDLDNDINSQDLIARAFNRDSAEVRYDETNRYINKVVSNDPHHNSTANTKTYDVFDYSIFAHRSRYKSITKYNENVAQIAKPLLEKCWLFGSDTLSNSYYTHWKKSLADKGNLKNSLVLSEPFLAAFFKLSNRGFNLEIRETRGVVGSYHIAVYHKNHLSDNDFVPPASVQVSMDKDSQRFIYKGKDALFDIGQLLQKGWTDQTTPEKWSHERKYHVVTQGKLSDLTAHWLWSVLAEQMLTADLKDAAYYKTKGSFESHYIDNGTIYVDSHNKTVYSLSEDYTNRQSSYYLQTSINRQYSNSLPVEVVAIPISGVKFKVGQALFEVYAKGLIPSLDKYLSLFISGQNEGFYQKDRNHTTYTLLETDSSGAITTIYSFVDISGAIKKMVSMLVENEYVKAMGMDVFDVTRSVVATGRALGCEIGIGFTFENVKTDFSDRDITLISQDDRLISEIQDFNLDV